MNKVKEENKKKIPNALDKKKFEKIKKEINEKIKSMDIQKCISSIKENPSDIILSVIHTFPTNEKDRQEAINRGMKLAYSLQKKLFGDINKTPKIMFSNLIALDFLLRLTAMNIKMGMELLDIPINVLKEKKEIEKNMNMFA